MSFRPRGVVAVVSVWLCALALCTLLVAHVTYSRTCGARKAESDPGLTFQYELTVCTMVHNENRYLPEWLEFHKLQGVDHFVVFDDGSADPRSNLESYLADGTLELRTVNTTVVPACVDNPDPKSYKLWDCQRALFQQCIDDFAWRTRWLGIWDTDEFIFAPMDGNGSATAAIADMPGARATLVSVLSEHPRASGFRFTGAVFGTSGLESDPGNAPGLTVPMVTMQLTHRQRFDNLPGDMGPMLWAHKMIANPRHVAASNIHWFTFKRCASTRVVAFDVARPGEPVVMFHLQYRSKEAAARKAALNHNTGVDYNATRDAVFNAVVDDRAAAFAPNVAERLRARFKAPAPPSKKWGRHGRRH